jgi:hypothetical protein
VEEDGGNSEPPPTFLPALEGTDIMRKYLMKVMSMVTPWLSSAALRTRCTELSKK